jgi:hypothetical protein
MTPPSTFYPEHAAMPSPEVSEQLSDLVLRTPHPEPQFDPHVLPFQDRSLLLEALEGKRGDDQKRIADAVVELGATLLRKNKDYGSSVWKRPFLLPNLPTRSAILVRMSDKIARIGSLIDRDPEVKGESLVDTMKDLVAYGVLWLAAPKG